nr:hypothetical protein [Tanacetum cinerariifolium]
GHCSEEPWLRRCPGLSERDSACPDRNTGESARAPAWASGGAAVMCLELECDPCDWWVIQLFGRNTLNYLAFGLSGRSFRRQ